MHARSTTVDGDPACVDDAITFVHGTVLPAVPRMTGCLGLSMLADRDSGRCILTTSWADADAMHGSAEAMSTMREALAVILRGQPEVQEWEIAVLHRRFEIRDGACARVVWSRADPALIDRTVDGYRMSLLPDLEEMPGFCSVSLLVDRGEGRAVSTTTYDTREAMDQTRNASAFLRDEFAQAMGVSITEVAEFDVVLAHLRVPETA